MKRWMSILACSLLTVFFSSMLMGLSGVGVGGTGAQGSAQLSFDATLMDTENNTVKLNSVTIEGRTTFQASMGKGRITIPFDEISRIQIKGKNACVTLKNSRQVCNLTIKESSRITGTTSFGLYQISVSDIVWIEISKAR